MKRLLNRFLTCVALSASMTVSDIGCAAASERISFNDAWRFSFDNDTAAVNVHLPHSWNSDAYATKNYYRGAGTYTKEFLIPETFRDKQIYLKLDGAASKSEIRINGQRVGRHVGAYSSHTVDITPFVNPGDRHMLEVTVDNSDGDVPPYSADFTFMGGLYRDAWLIATPKLHLNIIDGPENGFRVDTRVNSDGSGALDVSGVLVNENAKKSKATIWVKVCSPDGSQVGQAEKSLNLAATSGMSFEINVKGIKNPALWSPESPNLYDVVVEVRSDGEIIDTSSCHVGFRTFGFDSSGRFILNGKPYKLRGMCRHQDQKPMGIALSDEQHRRDIELMKDMGANFIRISHYPQDDAVVEMCDRLGLIAWEEIPVIDYVPVGETFADNCETMLREMIGRHYNHPSIVMWGYMNEILLRMPRENQEQTKARTLALAERLEKVLREEDSSRLSTMAFHGSDIYHGAGLAGVTDVKGWNLYQGWYGGRLPDFEAYLSRQHREHPSHRLIVSEYGAGSDLRLHSLSPEPFDFSMEYQQDYLEHYLPVIEDSVFVAGASHWNLIDFSSANRAESMPHINNKGLVTNDRRKKDVYYFYKASWTDVADDTVAHIAVRDWPERTELIGPQGLVSRPVKVYTNLPSVSLIVNGRKLGDVRSRNCSAVFSAELRDGRNIIELATAGKPSEILDVAIVNLSAIRHDGNAIELATDELAINVGADCYFRSDDSGLTWLPDREYSQSDFYGHIGGRRAVSQDEIRLTSDQPLLQRGLTGLEEYRIDVADGRYEVELSFAELSAPSAQSAYMLGRNAGSAGNGWTDMDISINGVEVEKGFSPGQTSGVKTMVRRRYQTEATGRRGISVKFNPAEGAVTSLSAIKIRKL